MRRKVSPSRRFGCMKQSSSTPKWRKRRGRSLGAAASKPAAAVQEVAALLHPVAKKPISLRGVAAASNAGQDAAVVVGRRRGIASCLLAALAGASSSGGAARAAILEANDDLELLERVKEDKKKRLQKQGIISSSAAETGYLQDLVYNLSKVGQAIDKDDLAAAGDFSSSSEEKSTVENFNSLLSSLFTSVSKSDINSSKSVFVSSATALEKWVELAGLTGSLHQQVAHAVPAFASSRSRIGLRSVLFTRTILHDLCTLGFATRVVIKSFCNGDPAAVQNIFGRFLLHVYPGEMLVTKMVQYQTKVKERDRAVLSGYVLLKQHIPSSL
ncbi:hypothetical protein ZWY2020_007335 [Hordeum vulgare]|nr:hypothetical protein ZWY2020_007335 [Hordeum vulgare]